MAYAFFFTVPRHSFSSMPGPSLRNMGRKYREEWEGSLVERRQVVCLGAVSGAVEEAGYDLDMPHWYHAV